MLAAGSRAVWPAEAQAQALHERLPGAVRERIALAQGWARDGVHFDAVLHSGPRSALPAVLTALAARRGPIAGVTQLDSANADVPPERLVVERSLAINTAAAGGNASLMMVE